MRVYSKLKDKLVLEKKFIYNKYLDKSEVKKTKDVVLFYIPESFYEIHFVSMCVLSKSLQELGRDVLITKCHSQFELCPPYVWLDENATSQQKKKRCNDCSELCANGIKSYGIPYVNLANLLNKNILLEIDKLLENATNNLLDFSYNGIDFGKLTSFQFVLLTKVSKFYPITSDQRIKWLKLIQTAIISYLHVIELSKTISFKKIVYFDVYATGVGAACAAKEIGVPSIYAINATHRGFDRRKFILSSPIDPFHMPFDWNDWRELKVESIKLVDVYLDLINNIFSIGTHRYSPSKQLQTQDYNVLEEIGVDAKGKKILVAYTSSEDEILGINFMFDSLGLGTINEKKDAFASQMEWFEEIIQFVEKSDKYHLIIRIHPRSGKNKFNNIVSELYLEFLEKFSFEMKNCTIIHPHSPVSSYDLLEIADLCLVSWSTIGDDISRLGVPCLSSILKSQTYPNDIFVHYENSKEKYFEKLELLVNQDLSIKSIIYAYRWYCYSRFSNAIEMLELSSNSNFEGFPLVPKNSTALRKIDYVLFNGEKTKDLNLLEVSLNQSFIPDERETMVVLLKHLAHVSVTGVNLIKEHDFESNSLPDINMDDFEFSIDKGRVLYSYQNQKYSRHSPYVCKLLKLIRNIT